VGIKEIRDFQSKLQDLPQIHDAIFVTNARFSSEAEIYSAHHKIVLWDGEKLSRIHYLMNIGRFKQASEDIIISTTLPVNMSFDEFARISLVNPLSLVLTDSRLIFKPYYVVSFSFRKTKPKFPTLNRQSTNLNSIVIADIKSSVINSYIKKQTYRNTHSLYANIKNQRNLDDYEECISIVDAITGKILTNSIVNDQSTNHLFSISRNFNTDNTLEDIEMNYTITDLQTIEPVADYKIGQTPEYIISINEPKLHQNAVERIILEKVVQLTKLRYHEVKINGSSLLFVPKWTALVQAKGKDMRYKRQALAASGIILCDELELCSKDDMSPRFRKADLRKTFAACEYCGWVLCTKHLTQKGELYFCEDHIDLIPSDNITRKHNDSRVKDITSRIFFSLPRTLRNNKQEHVTSDTSTQITSENQVLPIQDSNNKIIHDNNSRSPILSSSQSNGKSAMNETKESSRSFTNNDSLPRIKKYTSEGKVVG
jgi:hypothetical protein